MTAPYTGGCACGEVRVRVSTEPIAVRQCWCRQCRQLAGGGPTHNAIFAIDAIALTGRTAAREYTAASGNTMVHEFCAGCGTPVLGRSSARPGLRALRLGLIDEPHGLAPRMAIWTDEAPRWAVIDPTLERHRRQPPPAPAPD